MGGNVGTVRHPTDLRLDVDPWLAYAHSEKRPISLMAISPNVTCNLGAHIDEAAFAGQSGFNSNCSVISVRHSRIVLQSNKPSNYTKIPPRSFPSATPLLPLFQPLPASYLPNL